MASVSQSVGEGGQEFFTLTLQFFYNLSAISIKEDGRRLPSDQRIFIHQIGWNIF
jgi:hypothetical protein